MNRDRLKTELGRIRGAMTAGSFDRETALNALDQAEAACDEKDPADTRSKEQRDRDANERPQPSRVQPALAANPVPEQVGKPFVPGGTVAEAPYPHPPVNPPTGHPAGG